MDELMQQMADKFGDMVQAVIIEKTKVIDIDQTLPLELNQKHNWQLCSVVLQVVYLNLFIGKIFLRLIEDMEGD